MPQHGASLMFKSDSEPPWFGFLDRMTDAELAAIPGRDRAVLRSLLAYTQARLLTTEPAQQNRSAS